MKKYHRDLWVPKSPKVSWPFLGELVDCGTHADAAGLQLPFDPAQMEVVGLIPDESVLPDPLRNRFDNGSGIAHHRAKFTLCHGLDSCRFVYRPSDPMEG
jgi:hypothetical protein